MEGLIKDIKPKNLNYLEYLNNGMHKKFVNSKDEIATIVDEPAVLACEILYDKNILPVAGGINSKRDKAFFILATKTLSEENQKVLYEDLHSNASIQEFNVKDSFGSLYIFSVSISENDSISEVREKLAKYARLFYPQDVLYGSTTISDYWRNYTRYGNTEYCINNRTKLFYSVDEINRMIQSELHWLFTTGDGIFYVSEELMRKHEEYLKLQPQKVIKQNDNK